MHDILCLYCGKVIPLRIFSYTGFKAVEKRDLLYGILMTVNEIIFSNRS